LAQVSQVDQVPWVWGCVSGEDRQQDRQDRHMIWRATLPAILAGDVVTRREEALFLDMNEIWRV